MQVRTRFAPSPTGYLHVGSVRTALFSWLYAKRHNGKFILRIEDTDRERSTDESVQAILDGMQWLSMDYDEGPFYQTHRYPRYLQAIQELLDAGKAYRCNCSRERIEELRNAQILAKEKPRYDGHCRDLNIDADESGFVVRFKNPSTGVVTFDDEVYGKISVDNQELDDLIILRSDGNPTYNFVVVMDDLDMQITHVIRGDDHINNTPRQINLFEALGAKVPVFAHLPMILGDDGKRLSKRHGAISVLQFKETGFLPHALLNYLVRLGWAHGDQEIFSLDEMIANFDLQNISRGASAFDHDKLSWLNQHYQKSDDPSVVAKALEWHFSNRGIDTKNGPPLSELVTAQAEKCKNLVDMCEISLYFYQDEIEYNEKMVKKHLTADGLRLLSVLQKKLESVDSWQKDVLQACINEVVASEDVGYGKLAQPLRVAITGSSSSPSIDLTLTLLGKQKVLDRLSKINSIV
ncbi:MAG: glutamate--tRNA ligase [Legionellaceae bacterium]|nr:glutamate--tRNA ligase [Legionellaceae bacterium]